MLLQFTSVYGTSYINTNLTSNTTYAYSIRAIDEASNKSTYSNSISVKTGYVDSEPPSVPGNIQTSDITRNNISFTWDASTDNIGVTGYDIYRDNRLLASVTGTSYTHTGLTTNTSYTYTIKARDASYNRSANSMAYTETTKPDWYQYTVTDQYGATVDLYMSDLGGVSEGNTNPVKVVAKKSTDSQYKELIFSGDNWTSGNIYAYNPTINQSGSGYAKSISEIIKVVNIQYTIDLKSAELLTKLYKDLAINPKELTSEDILMLTAGVADSVDDNFFFGVIRHFKQIETFTDNYYYMRGKAYADAAILAGFLYKSLKNGPAMITALINSARLGGLALATLETGVGTVAFGSLAIGELARAGILAIPGVMAIRANKNHLASLSKLQNTQGFKIRNVDDNILDRFEGYKGGHTLEKHVAQRNEDLIKRANQEGVDASSFTNKSTAIKAVKENIRGNAPDIEKWLKSIELPDKKAFPFNHNRDVGYGVEKSTKAVKTNLRKSYVILIKDPTIKEGFYILTSYPKFD